MSVIQAPHGVLQRDGKYAMTYIIKPSVNLGLEESFFKIVTGINVAQQVIYIHPVSKITVLDTGCDSTPNDVQPERSDKWWRPNNVEALLSQCYTDVYGTIFEEDLKAGNDKYNLENTKIEKLLLDLLTPAAKADRVRMSWLSKKLIVAGELTSGAADVKNYNQLDGAFEKIRVGVVAGLIPLTPIAKNTAGTTMDARELADGEALTILKAVRRKAKLLLKQAATNTKVFFVTRSIYENYEEYLDSNKQLESSWVSMQNGDSVISYKKIPLIVLDAVDVALENDFKIGGLVNMVHRVVLTVKDNIQLGLDTDGALTFEAWVERLKKRWYARLMYKLDIQIADERLVSVAY